MIVYKWIHYLYEYEVENIVYYAHASTSTWCCYDGEVHP